jgi:peptidylprolyl isomerase/FKBP-type peptidyl-prolyl cis-trans isomerase FklB
MFVAAAVAALSLAACNAKPPANAQQSAQSEAWLAHNAKEAGVKVLPSGLQYKVLSSGPASGAHPGPRDEVKVDYVGQLTDGKVFDSSVDRGAPAVMGLADLVPAWREAVPMMRPGDEWVLYVPPKLGYGETGAGGVIPPNAVLVFKIKLIGVLSHGPAQG